MSCRINFGKILNGLIIRHDVSKLQANENIIHLIVRSVWTADDDIILLHAYTILKHRVLHITFERRPLWKCVAKYIPDKNAQACRTHFDVLLSRPGIIARLQHLADLWVRMYDQYIRDGTFAQDFTNQVDFDMSFQIKKFLTVSQNGKAP